MARSIPMPWTLWLVALLIVPFASSAAEPSFKTEDERAAYMMGALQGQQLGVLQFTEAELQMFLDGARAGLLGEADVNVQRERSNILRLRQERQKLALDAEVEAGAEFQKQMAAEPGAQKLESGLILIPTVEGLGEAPTVVHKVTVHYHGTLRDGTVFDSSRERDQPASFGLNRVIPCWTEGLQLMKVGGKATLICPPEIAYGNNGRPPTIKPGATLKFEVELISIE